MKHLKFLFGALLLTATVVGAFAFTSKDYHKAVDVVCYEFQLPAPNSTNVIQSGNYLETIPDCPGVAQKWCAICFDRDLYPQYLDDEENLDFTNEVLMNVVSSYWNQPIQDGQTISGITLQFRSN